MVSWVFLYVMTVMIFGEKLFVMQMLLSAYKRKVNKGRLIQH